MELALKKSLNKWWNHIEALDSIERIYRNFEASEKTMLGVLVGKDKGDGGITERTSRAKASQDYIDLCNGLAETKVSFHTAERKLELYKKAFDAEYLTSKQEFEAINKRNINGA